MKSYTNRFRVWGWALGLFLFACSLQAQRPITPQDIVSFESVREVAVAPGGQWIAYTRRIPEQAGAKLGRSHNELWLSNKEGTVNKQLISKPMSVWSISWSADGSHIHFLAVRPEHASGVQIYALPIEGGEAKPLTQHQYSIGSYQFSPDGKMLAFTARELSTAQEKKDKAVGKDWVVYGEGQKYTRLYLDDFSGSLRPLAEGDYHVTGFTWSSNNKDLAFTASKTPATDNVYMFQSIYLTGINGSAPTLLTKTEGKLGHLAFSPDGSKLAWNGAVDISDPLPQSLFVSDLSGKKTNLTPKLEASVNNVSWKDNSTLIMHCAEGTYSALYSVDASKGKRKELYNDGAIFYGYSLDLPSGTIAFAGSTPQHPSELMAGNIKDMKMKRLTQLNPGLAGIKLGKQEVISWKGPDGLRIEGILTYPIDYKSGKKYPLLLQIHGGPEGVSYNGFNTRAVYPVQLYASNGYFVLEPNYRGSQGRGVAFAKADHKDLAGKEFDDVLAGIDYLIDKGFVDGDQVGTGGFSYGGYFSAWAATKHSQRFKAAMVGAGITNWISFTGTTDIIYENSLVHWALWWYDHMELVWDRSPLAHINNSQTATLVVHGERDLRVPIGQGEELYNALKLKDVPTQMVKYLRQPHGIRERPAMIDYMNRCLGWFDKYVKK